MMNAEEFFNRLEEHLQQDKPFAAWHDPGSGRGMTTALLQDDASENLVDDFNESGFVFAPFQNDLPTYIIPQEKAEFLQTEYSGFIDHEKALEKESPDFPPEQFIQKEKSAHENLVQKGIDAIKAGAFKKVVLSRKEEVETQLGPLEIFKDLLKKYKEAFVYIWFHPKTDIWLGATPETLLKVERNKFKTMALAGTQAFKGITDVTWGKKEIEEQKIVTDFILENVERVTAGKVDRSEAYTARAGNLLHLRTDIQGDIQPSTSNLKELIMTLHPTPAVCGMPRDIAKQFILENENYDREFYTGFLGELNFKKETKRSSNRRNQENQAYASISSSTSLFVNLRCMKIEDDEAEIFVGGGITKDSDPVQEFEETQNKAQTIKAVLVK
ncbi:MAG: chorismate-binding protein [Salegentibacter sp.]|uniref:chorismate-binding protein n=1 Tax=Salegentibacter sp. TaxID=1903072 RepID=UPI0028709B92|nr:chorismate-binding protein [Salegentibacter sp.]MDR9457504.1 chorismate-binding protein [Salegentibacter sp.]